MIETIADIVTVIVAAGTLYKFLATRVFPRLERSARRLLTKMRPPVIQPLSVHVADGMVFGDSFKVEVKPAGASRD